MLELHVTQDHIDRGNRRGDRCPIALAGVDAGLESPLVGHTFMHWRQGPDHFSAKLPADVVEWIRRFGFFAVVEPMSFQVDPFPSIPIPQKDLV
jgi:hypothetical protein